MVPETAVCFVCFVFGGLQLDDAPVGLALGTAALGIAIMELSKAPESPPGFYSFDPLNLKDSNADMAHVGI